MLYDRTMPKPSEYGGLPGLIQPTPHTPTASERRMLLTATDPDDETSGNDIVSLIGKA